MEPGGGELLGRRWQASQSGGPHGLTTMLSWSREGSRGEKGREVAVDIVQACSSRQATSAPAMQGFEVSGRTSDYLPVLFGADTCYTYPGTRLMD